MGKRSIIELVLAAIFLVAFVASAHFEANRVIEEIRRQTWQLGGSPTGGAGLEDPFDPGE